MCLSEIVYTQKEADTTGHLASNNGSLVLSIGLCEKNASLTSWRTHDDPSFRMSVVRNCWRILYQLKSELLNEKLNRRVIALHDERDQV